MQRNELPPHVHPDDTVELIAGWTDDGNPGFVGEDFCDVHYSGSVPPLVFDEARRIDWIVDSIKKQGDDTVVRFRYDG